MLSLKEYISESSQVLLEQKNLHMDHLDELVFNEGVDGLRDAINYLRGMRDMLSGGKSTTTTSVKFDGAPSIFVGIDPEDGKFFVAKKSLFNKDSRTYKSHADIDNDTSGDLAQKLKIAFDECSKLGITSGVYQGDIMFTNSSLKVENIEGKDYVTFHPNTIVYAVPYESKLARKILKSKIGIVFHTTYTGKSIQTMKASFGKSIVDKFNKVNSSWIEDATYKDLSGKATFNSSELEELTGLLSKAGSLFRTLNSDVINQFRDDPDLSTMVKAYNNSKIREGVVTDPNLHVTGMFHYIADKYQKEINSKKTPKGKEAWEEKRKKVMRIFANDGDSQLITLFTIVNLLVAAKKMVIKKMNYAGGLATFIKTKDGFKVTDQEGFVAISLESGKAVKLVDRLTFSYSNFSPDVIKGFER